MIRFIIQEQEKPEEEKVVRLALRTGPFHGGVVLVAVDAAGDKVPLGSLLFIMPDGRIERAHGVNPKLGFQLDRKGGIKLLEEEE